MGCPIRLAVCLGLIWLAIKREHQPLLLLPNGFGDLLASVALAEIAEPGGFLYILYEKGVSGGLFPLLIFMGVGAMTDSGPLLANPRTAAAQPGILATLIGALALSQYTGLVGFSRQEAESTGSIGGRICSAPSRSWPTRTWPWCRASSRRSCGC